MAGRRGRPRALLPLRRRGEDHRGDGAWAPRSWPCAARSGSRRATRSRFPVCPKCKEIYEDDECLERLRSRHALTCGGDHLTALLMRRPHRRGGLRRLRRVGRRWPNGSTSSGWSSSASSPPSAAGIFRDLVIDEFPPLAFADWRYAVVAAVTAVAGLLAAPPAGPAAHGRAGARRGRARPVHRHRHAQGARRRRARGRRLHDRHAHRDRRRACCGTCSPARSRWCCAREIYAVAALAGVDRGGARSATAGPARSSAAARHVFDLRPASSLRGAGPALVPALRSPAMALTRRTAR